MNEDYPIGDFAFNKTAVLEAQEQIYNLVCKHFPNDDNFRAFYKEFAEIRKELE